jgi:hypothetical protein
MLRNPLRAYGHIDAIVGFQKMPVVSVFDCGTGAGCRAAQEPPCSSSSKQLTKRKGANKRARSGGNGDEPPEMQNSSGFNLKFFVFNGHEVTILIHDDGSIWFIAKECCDALEYVNSRDATKRHCKHSIKAGVAKRDAIGRLQNYTIIPESDLYRLITNAKTPKAEPF